MTTLISNPQARAAEPTSGARFHRAVGSDLRNVLATPTARLLLMGSVAMAIASSLAGLTAAPDGEATSAENLQLVMHSSTVATLMFAIVAGLVSSTSDFRFGRIDQLLLNDPNRTMTVWAKTAVGLATGFAFGLLGAVAAMLTLAVYGVATDTTIDLTARVVVLPLVGATLGAPLFTAIGVCVGLAVRNQPAAIAGSLAALLIIEPTAIIGIPSIGKWLPGASGLALTNTPDPNLLGQVPGGLVLIGWTALAAVVGIHRLRAADV